MSLRRLSFICPTLFFPAGNDDENAVNSLGVRSCFFLLHIASLNLSLRVERVLSAYNSGCKKKRRLNKIPS